MAETNNRITFSVDTHLFRELGELLVGRDATALLELVKNAYDADATAVTVSADALQDPAEGCIRIADDGHGMSRAEFENGFLRIASRIKETGDRRSPFLRRRFTGAKGVGRLAAHKLARFLEVESTPAVGVSRGPRRRVVASIDWDLIESVPTLDAVPVGAIHIQDLPVPGGAASGTSIVLRRLRRPWTQADITRFAGEVAGFEPLSFLVNPLARGFLRAKPLLERPRIRDTAKSKERDSFALSLQGDFRDQGDRSEDAVLEHVEWVIELRVDGPRGLKKLAILPTSKADKSSEAVERDLDLREHERDLKYDARIMIRPGPVPRALAPWSQRASGIRVFMEGFRVLPYGEPGDDWLGLDRDVTERTRKPDQQTAELAKNLLREADEDVGLGLLPNKHYYGAVFLTTSGSPSLQMLVNREGFIPGPAFMDLRESLRSAIWLAQYQIYASKAAKRMEARTTHKTFQGESRRFANLLDEVQSLTKQKELAALRSKLPVLERSAVLLRGMAKEIVEEAALLRDTASVGLQMARFVHELNGLLGVILAIEASIQALLNDSGLSKSARADLRRVINLVEGLRKALERNSNYFGGLLSNTARRRRSLQPLAERLEEVIDILSPAIAERTLTIENRVTNELRTAPMFASEVRTIFLNLLTNAIKAAGKGGRIRITAKRARGEPRVQITMSNTGVRVKLADAERWFEPFRTTTQDPDPVLGQGLGLGLPIVRMIVRDYGGVIGFGAPPQGYRSAVTLTLPLKV